MGNINGRGEMADVGRRLSPIPHLQYLRSAIQSGVALWMENEMGEGRWQMWEGVYLQFPIFNLPARQSKAAWRFASRRTPKKRVPFWSAPAERSDDGALDREHKWERGDGRCGEASISNSPSLISPLGNPKRRRRFGLGT